MVDGVGGVIIEMDLLVGFEFVQDERHHQLLEVALVVQKVSVLEYLFIGLLFDAGEGFKKATFGLRKRASLL